MTTQKPAAKQTNRFNSDQRRRSIVIFARPEALRHSLFDWINPPSSIYHLYLISFYFQRWVLKTFAGCFLVTSRTFNAILQCIKLEISISNWFLGIYKDLSNNNNLKSTLSRSVVPPLFWLIKKPLRLYNVYTGSKECIKLPCKQ